LSEEVDIHVTRLYEENLDALLHSDKRYIVNEGGARSGKSYSIMQVLITYAINNANTSITVVSHSLPHLKKGALRDFTQIINAMGWYRDEWHNKTDNLYNLPNGSYIEFYGLEEHDKAKGPGRKIMFMNEANLNSKALFDQLDMRTQWKVFLDLNPADFDSWCYTVADSDDAVKIHSTYLDNEFLPAAQVRVIESYKDADEMMWQVFGLGLRGTSKEQIYTHWRLTDNIPEGQVFYGLDFGYNVPSALVRVTIHEGSAYVKQVLYKTKLTTNDLVEEMKGLAIRNEEIFCDAAEPKTIEELYRAGFNVKPADKDVTEGIRKVKSIPLYIQKDSQDIINEIKKYKWMVDKNERVLDEPDKAAGSDHLMDSMRYAIFTKLKTPSITWGAL
jgi:phage terminase large subunit